MSRAKFNTIFNDTYAQREFDPRITLQQLQVDKQKFFSWGVYRVINLYNKGLLFKVQANHFKGWVLITLGWNDTYIIRYFNQQFNKVLNLKTERNIYCDVLADTIDITIERIPQYKN